MNIANNDGRSSGIYWPTSGIDRQITIHYVINMRVKETNVWTIFDPYHNHCMNTVIS